MTADPWAAFPDAPAQTNAASQGDAWDQFPDAGTRAGQKVDVGTALGYGIANAVPFSHDIGAAIQAGETYLPKWAQPDQTGETQPNEPFSQRFADQRQRIGGVERAIQESGYAPAETAATIGASIGALPVAGPVEAISNGIRTVVPRMGPLASSTLGSAAVGAGYGALSGAGTGDTTDQRLHNAGIGSVVGGIGGAAAPALARGFGNILSGVGQYFQGADTAATKRLAQAVAIDQRAGSSGMSAADQAAARSAGQPILTGDVLAGPAVSRLAGEAKDASPEAGALLRSATQDRYETQGPRFADYLRQISGSNLNAQDTRDALLAKARSYVTPAYQQAMQDGANGVWNQDLQGLLSVPAVASAAGNATKKAAMDAAINGTQPIANPFVMAADGSVSLRTQPNGSQAVPSLQFWDYVKRGLDDQIGAAQRSGANDDARLLVGVKNKLLDNLDQNVPSYAAARSAAKGAFGADNALEAGENFLKVAPTAKTAEMKSYLASLPPAQQDLFAQGMMSQMAQTSMNAGTGRDLGKLFNSPEVAERMQLGLGQYAPQVESYLRTENTMNSLRNALGGSPTAQKLADASHNGTGLHSVLSSTFGTPLGGAMAGGAIYYERNGFEDPVGLLKASAAGGVAGLMLHSSGRLNAETMDAIAKQLTSPDPGVANRAIQTIGKSPDLLNALRSAEQKAITFAGPQLQMSGQQSEAQPAYAKGGAVKSKHDRLVSRLMSLADKAKAAEKSKTKNILRLPDNTVTTALAKANAAI